MRPLETAALWKGFSAGLVFWYRFHKTGFVCFSSDITVQQLTHFMGMEEV